MLKKLINPKQLLVMDISGTQPLASSIPTHVIAEFRKTIRAIMALKDSQGKREVGVTVATGREFPGSLISSGQIPRSLLRELVE